MKLKLSKPEGHQGIGEKYNQEDYGIMDAERPFLILCDGMGGHEHGEVASSTVCEALKEYFIKTPPANNCITKEYFNNAVNFAYEKLDAKDKNPDSIKKMGTTLTCVYFGDNGVLVAHTGDSRVYQIRPKNYTKEDYKPSIVIATKDHSLVAQLVALGEISEEEAKTHPKRNVITKCMQPHDDYDMPTYDSANVEAGDYFFLCSDGVLENITNEILCAVLSENISDKEKSDKLFKICEEGKTHDNFTFILVKVEEGELPALDLADPIIDTEIINESDSTETQADVDNTAVAKVEQADKANVDTSNANAKHAENTKANAKDTVTKTVKDFLNHKFGKIFIAIVVLAAIVMCYKLINSVLPDEQVTTPPKQETQSELNKPTEAAKPNPQNNNKQMPFAQKVNNLRSRYTSTPLNYNMFKFTKDPEVIIVNEKDSIIRIIVDSLGRGKWLLSHNIQDTIVDVEVGNFVLNDNTPSADIQLTTNNSQVITLTIDTKIKVIQTTITQNIDVSEP